MGGPYSLSEVVVGQIQIFQSEQEVIESLCGDLYQLVVVDDQVLQVDQTCQVPWPNCG